MMRPIDDDCLARVRQNSIRGASIADLVCVGFSRTEEDAKQAETWAKYFLMRYGQIAKLGDIGTSELTEYTGLDPFEIVRVQCLMELGRRAADARAGDVKSINGPEDVAKILSSLQREKREHFVAVLLTSKNVVMRCASIHVGTLTMSLVGAREVFREAIRDGASSIVVAHNHPSGDPTPSPEDIAVTKRLVEVGELLDIPVHDHVIIGDPEFRSLARMGLM